MKTTASNRKLRTLITDIRDNKLQPRPEFQRRLVRTSKDKAKFLETVLSQYPFPEIYIAAGSVDPLTGEGSEMLVDGQQRITTLYQYFNSSPDLRLPKDFVPYRKLTEEQQLQFLEYDVVVRDLGRMDIREIKKVFERINSTSYSLNAMEIHNARFNGEFKKLAEQLLESEFFENHRIFGPMDMRRMQDMVFMLSIMITVMSSYFNRDSLLKEYLGRYNDEFEDKAELRSAITFVLDFISKCDFGPTERIWKKLDLFTAVVEIHRAIYRLHVDLDVEVTCSTLKQFYHEVDNLYSSERTKYPGVDLEDYLRASQQASNDRNNRILRGEILQRILQDANSGGVSR